MTLDHWITSLSRMLGLYKPEASIRQHLIDLFIFVGGDETSDEALKSIPAPRPLAFICPFPQPMAGVLGLRFVNPAYPHCFLL
ncbi:MAG: hypothetical protein HC927_06645 [Deltaproteobacteria bacterium]|nr:hypothetical protein [Deltaproteobacteria bacterium]